MRYLSRILVISFCMLLFQAPSGAQNTSKSGARVSSSDIHALSQAIEDEVYADNLQADGYDAGVPVGKGGYQLRLYVQPAFNDQGLAWCIYKLMPYGEVLRMFWVGRNGTAFLYGQPSDHFPATGPSYLTAYMSDEDLSRDKETWSHVDFIVQLEPTVAEIREANERQRGRNVLTTIHIPPNEAAAQYRDSQRAADESAEGADPTGGATHYLLDYGQPLPIWAAGVTPVKTFGPFLKTIEAGRPPKDVKVKIVIIR